MQKTQNFIDKSQKIHNKKYNYSKTIYKNNRTKVEIICPIHGSFFQTPTGHLSQRGCRKCGRIISGSKAKSNLEHFINKSQIKHDKKYDYTKANYINSKTKLTIICPLHGEFLQTPSNHYQFGCIKCSHISTASKQTKNCEHFITESQKIHNNKYDYSKTEYKNANSKIIIKCFKHGEFLQTPHSHLAGRGCKKCTEGECHHWYGKPSDHSWGYHGKYKENIFRAGHRGPVV